jgi:uncharacterized delta-60 repeat protein
MSAKTKVSQAPYYVAVGRSRGGPTFEPSSLSYSLDGITWSASALPAEIDNFGNGVFGGDKFVAVTGNNTNKAAYSTNGINWTATTLPSARAWSALAYGDGKFVVLSADGSNVAAYSTDGITWTQTTLPASGSWVSVTYGDGKFVAIALYTFASAYSTDGITWNAGTMPTQQAWSSVAYGAGKFVALIDDSTNFAYSTNGITWTLGSMPYSYQRWVRIAYGNGKFVALVNNSDKSAYSLDGISWTASTMPSSKYWSAITYGNGKFVALAAESTTTAYSTDGITWSTSNITSAAGWASISYGNGTWRDMVAPHIKVSGAWKIAKSAYIKVSGSWKNWFLQGGINDGNFNAVDSFEGFNGFVRASAVQPDGKLIVVGSFTSYNRVAVNKIIRFNADKTIDTEFLTNIGTGPTGFSSNTLSSIALQSDGKILIGGSFEYFNNQPTRNLVRLNSNGTVDTGFLGPKTEAANVRPSYYFTSSITSIVLQPDGKILVAGTFPGYVRITFQGQAISSSIGRVARLNSDGTFDTEFFNNSLGAANNEINDIALQADGKILVGGNFSSFGGASVSRKARINANGSPDTAFNTAGPGLNDVVTSILVQPDGKIFFGGYFTNYPGVVRFNQDGTVDSGYSVGLTVGQDNAVLDMKFGSDGKLLIGGGFSVNTTVPSALIHKVNEDGSLDNSFALNVGGGQLNAVSLGEIITHISIESNGKIVVLGTFKYLGDIGCDSIAILNADGTRDSFALNYGASQRVNTFAVAAIGAQADGKIILGGSFLSYNGVLRSKIARINSDGQIDNTFNVNLGKEGFDSAFAIAIQQDQKILVGGGFQTVNGSPARLIRINSDGTLDSSFNSNIDFIPQGSQIKAIKIQSDGKIIVSGNLYSFNGSTPSNLVRLNSNGTVDTDFGNNAGTGPNSAPYAIAIQPDGKIIIVGFFFNFSSTPVYYLARLNSNGSRDTSFTSNTGTGANDDIWDVAVQADGKIILVGDFTTFNGVTANRIVRLNSDGTRDTAFTANTGTGPNSRIYSIAIQPNGKIVLGGQFTTFNGATVNRIVRLNADGTRDTAFTANTGVGVSSENNPTVRVVNIDSSGNLLIGGGFSKFNNIVRNGIAKIGSDEAY